MGTRNLTCVVENGEFKVAQYGQWDGYPSNAGLSIKKFCEDKEKLNSLKENLKDVNHLSKEFVRNLWEQNSPQWNDWEGDYAQLSRNVGWTILSMLSEKPMDIYLNIEFAGYSLFCEWCYVIDFDRNTFEVYEGFNKEPLTEKDRFFFLQEKLNKFDDFDVDYIEQKYMPVKLFNFYLLDRLPNDEQFLQENPDTGSDEE